MPAHTKGKHNTRQRKKLRLGEFREFGFRVTAKIGKEMSEQDKDAFMDDLIATAEARSLLLGGGLGDEEFFAFVCKDGRRQSTTEEDRAALTKWLSSRAELKDVFVGEMEDAWF